MRSRMAHAFTDASGARASAWEVLGLPRCCTAEDAKRAYKQLVRQAHPDKGGDPARFEQVQRAYRLVSREIGLSSDVEPDPDHAGVPGGGAKLTPSAAAAVAGRHNARAKPAALALAAREEGNSAFREGRFEQALGLYSRALALLPGDAASLCNRAAALHGLGRFEESLRDARVATEVAPRWAKAHYRCASACAELARWGECARHMKHAFELSPGDEQIREARARLEQKCSASYCHLVLAGHADSVHDLAFRPSTGRGGGADFCTRPLIATACLDGKVRVWCASSGILMHTLIGHTDKITSVIWSPCGELLASLSVDETIRIWAAESGFSCMHTLRGHKGRATCAAFISPSKLLSGSADGTVMMWDARGGTAATTLHGHLGIITDLDYLASASLLATASGDGTFRLWDGATGKCVQVVDWQCGPLTACIFAPLDSAALVTAHWESNRESSRILVWDVHGKAGWVDGKISSHVMHFEGFCGKVTCLDVVQSQDGVLMAAGCADGTTRVYDLDAGMCLYDLVAEHEPQRGLAATVTCLKFSHDGRYFATGGLDGRVSVWASEEGEYQVTLAGHRDRICNIQWSKDDSRLGTCAKDGVAKVWRCDF